MLLKLIKLLVAVICAGFFINELIVVIIKYYKDSFLAMDQILFEQLSGTYTAYSIEHSY